MLNGMETSAGVSNSATLSFQWRVTLMAMAIYIQNNWTLEKRGTRLAQFSKKICNITTPRHCWLISAFTKQKYPSKRNARTWEKILLMLSSTQETLPSDCLLCGLYYPNVFMLEPFLDTFNSSLSGSSLCFETGKNYTHRFKLKTRRNIWLYDFMMSKSIKRVLRNLLVRITSRFFSNSFGSFLLLCLRLLLNIFANAWFAFNVRDFGLKELRS